MSVLNNYCTLLPLLSRTLLDPEVEAVPKNIFAEAQNIGEQLFQNRYYLQTVGIIPFNCLAYFKFCIGILTMFK